jgi:hypothetical protein
MVTAEAVLTACTPQCGRAVHPEKEPVRKSGFWRYSVA